MSLIEQLRRAIAKGIDSPESVVLEIQYRDAKGHETQRTISPVRLEDDGQSLMALCLAKEEPRKFKLASIKSFTLVDANDCMMPMPMVTKGHPLRIQRSREKCWTMPEGAIYVGRPTAWGNPFETAEAFLRWLSSGDFNTDEITREDLFDSQAAIRVLGYQRQRILRGIDLLRGKQLACWCSLQEVCHADVLASLANR